MVNERRKICETCGHILSISSKHKNAIRQAQKKKWDEFRKYKELKEQEEQETKIETKPKLEPKPNVLIL